MPTLKLNGPLGGDYQTDGAGNAVALNTYPQDEIAYAPTRGTLQPTLLYRAYHAGWSTALGGIDVHPQRLYVTPSQLGGRGSIDQIIVHINENGGNQPLRVGYYREMPSGALTLEKDFGFLDCGTDDDVGLVLTVAPAWLVPAGPGWFGLLNAGGGYVTLGALTGSSAYQDLFGMIEAFHGNGSGNRWFDAGISVLPEVVPPADDPDWTRDDSGYSESVAFVAVRGATGI